MTTRKRQLRNGRSLWLAYRAPRIKTVSAAGGKTADVLIVGAGISGALIGELLAAQDYSVVFIDRRGPAIPVVDQIAEATAGLGGSAE